MASKIKRGMVGASSINKAIDDAERVDSYAVAGLPTAASSTGKIVYCSNGASGSPCLAYSNGANWLRIVLGAAVAIS